MSAVYPVNFGANSREFFEIIVTPLFRRYCEAPAERDLVWGVVVALDQMLDHVAIDTLGDRRDLHKFIMRYAKLCPDIAMLRKVSNTFKHSVSIAGGDVIGRHAEVDNDLYAPDGDFYENPNDDFYGDYAILISGTPEFIQRLIRQSYAHWLERLTIDEH